MPVDIETQLARYGDVLREQLAAIEAPTGPPATTPTVAPTDAPTEAPTDASTDAAGPTSPDGPITGQQWDGAHRRGRRRRARLGFVAAVLALVIGAGGGLAFVASRTAPSTGAADLVGAVAIDDPADIERRPGDPETFLDRLSDVDHELILRPGRAPTDRERAAVADLFRAPDGRRLDPASIAVTLELDGGFLLMAFDETDAEPVGANRLQCRAVVRDDGSELRNNTGHSCWDPADPPPAPVDGGAPQFSYGCQPAVHIFGFVAVGRGDFVATVNLPPGAPGVLFTLEDGDVVLVRPVDDLVVYAGPPATTMEVFQPGGRVDTIDTSDCG